MFGLTALYIAENKGSMYSINSILKRVDHGRQLHNVTACESPILLVVDYFCRILPYFFEIMHVHGLFRSVLIDSDH